MTPPTVATPVVRPTPDRVVATADDIIAASVTVSDLDIDGKRASGWFVDRYLGGQLEWTIEGASTLTIALRDTQGEVSKSKLITRATTVEFDEVSFTLVAVDGTWGEVVTLTFEDTVVWRLRRHRTPKRAVRGEVTRGQFMVGLVQENKPRIPVVAPEQNVALPIAEGSATSSGTTDRSPGFAPGARLTVKGKDATTDQLRILATVLSVGVARKASVRVLEAAVATATQESVAKNLVGGDEDSAGVFQQRQSQGWGTYAQVRDVPRAAGKFYDGAIPFAKANPSASIAEIAQHVQNSKYPSAYAKWAVESKRTVAAYNGVAGAAGTTPSVSTTTYEYTRGAPGGPVGEDTWLALLRLADEVGWRRWAFRGRVYIMSEVYLYQSAPWATLRPGAEALVKNPPFNFDVGKPAAEVTLQVYARRWSTPPGAIIELDDWGDTLDGRWLVQKISRPLESLEASIVLVKPRPELPEPAAESSTDGVGGDAATGTEADAMYAAAVAITKHHWSYRWGGGHDGAFTGPYDCSGAVSKILNVGGFLSTPQTTVGLQSFGEAGEGEFVTVWVRETGNARQSHTFIEFKRPGHAVEHFGTGTWGSSYSGAGLKPQRHPRDGFTPRHPRGL